MTKTKTTKKKKTIKRHNNQEKRTIPREKRNKNGAGRPIKLTKKRLNALKSIINDGFYRAIICTNEELVRLTNKEVTKPNRLNMDLFYKYKADFYPDNPKYSPLLEEFHNIVKEALFIQKENIFKRLGHDEKAWQRRAWIIERKFEERNLKKKIENEVTHYNLSDVLSSYVEDGEQ